jgi:chromosome segregation ATPase
MEETPKMTPSNESVHIAKLAEFGHAIEKAEANLAEMEAQVAEFARQLEGARAAHAALEEENNQALGKLGSESDPEGKLARQLSDVLSAAADRSREHLKNAESMHLSASLMTEDFREAYRKLKNMRRLFLEGIK